MCSAANVRVNAYILAGGASSRMGRDKGLLEVGGETLIERAISSVCSIADEVKLVGDHPHLERFGRTVQDQFRGCGPLGGVHAALLDSDSEWNLLFAVDQIWASSGLLPLLVARAESAPENCLVIVPKIEGRAQPLCAMYRRAFAHLAAPALKAGEFEIKRLFESAHAIVLDEQEFERAGVPPPKLHNVNMPEDFAMLKRRIEGEGEPGP